MSKDDVIALMMSSKDTKEWNANCDKVKAAHSGQYPDYWYKDVILAGIADYVLP